MSPAAATLSPRDKRALGEAEAALKAGRIDKAAAATNTLLAANPADPDTLNLAGLVALQAGKPISPSPA